MAGCTGCIEATPVTDRICVSDWYNITLDSATASIDDGEPISTTVVSLDKFFYSAGGVSQLLEIELEENATTLTTPAVRIVAFVGDVAPTTPVINTVYAVTTDRAGIFLLDSAAASGTKVFDAWQKLGAGQRVFQLDAKEYTIAAKTLSSKIHFVFLAAANAITFSGKSASMRVRFKVRFVS